ncbi:MAG: response regulator [Verrucomicrobiales bacterium]|nr:response regulator [Verrucomicrobiales bacterium]
MASQNFLSILLVEDNDDDVIFLERCMKKANLGHRLSRVSNGVEAMNYLLKVSPFEDANLPSLVLLDLNMPRKDGISVLKEVKAHPALKHIPVVVFTSSKQESEIRRCYAEGASSFIPKLTDSEELKKLFTTFSEYWERVACIPNAV